MPVTKALRTLAGTTNSRSRPMLNSSPQSATPPTPTATTAHNYANCQTRPSPPQSLHQSGAAASDPHLRADQQRRLARAPGVLRGRDPQRRHRPRPAAWPPGRLDRSRGRSRPPRHGLVVQMASPTARSLPRGRRHTPRRWTHRVVGHQVLTINAMCPASFQVSKEFAPGRRSRRPRPRRWRSRSESRSSRLQGPRQRT